MSQSSPTKLNDTLTSQKPSSVSCSESLVSQKTENPTSIPSSHISISSNTGPIPVSILSGNPKSQGSLVEIVQNHSDKPTTVILTSTPSSAPSIKTKFVQQTSPRIGPISPAEPPGGLFLKDLALSNQNSKLDGIKGWKIDRRKATPYPQPEAEEYEFDDTPEDVSTEDAEDDQ
ncbi:uncharacterized protein MELLADRAFT_74864 [Melampsora larici-populina 98AG31]|uniref:Uncharacterized protein n=1 Tax=Melampsora larici-populina (strain 98AG31 / pathotype 3-4-7) TaxID=747676 RepID=F4RMU1_MELLP|nr:uncharacterized protein MELLADRAFT_74864 [Melampsora larici-populina 98AG31]EGG06169.1 hypothetical protein MELLADRAFT_74864 [Melampsora larici-populina 98AG31]